MPKLWRYQVLRVWLLLVTSQMPIAQFHMVASGLGIWCCPTNFTPSRGHVEIFAGLPTGLCLSAHHPATTPTALMVLWGCSRQHSVMASKLLVLGVHIPFLSCSTDNNLGAAMKGFCRCNWSPKSVELKLGRILRWAWPNDINPLRAARFPLLLAEEEAKDSKHKRDSTRHCWPEDRRTAALTDWQLARKHGPQPYKRRKLSPGNLNELGSALSSLSRQAPSLADTWASA